MSNQLWVQVVAGAVSQVWDTTPPEGEAGWVQAVEVKPEIVANRQGYTHHVFDVTVNPVTISYGTWNIEVANRANAMKQNAAMKFQQLSNSEMFTGVATDEATLEEAKVEMEAKHALIESATTHNQLDAIQDGSVTSVAEVLAITTPDPILATISV